MAASIPRFLLPQGSSIWRSRTISNSTIAQNLRNVSQKVPPKKLKPGHSKPFVLEKPARFNPPSHSQKLRPQPRQYPGPRLSEADLEAQKTKRYPNMMPPEGTFMHWFLHDRSIHLFITLGTLFSLAGYTTVMNFKKSSKFGDMLPPATDLFFHPISFVQRCAEVFKLHTDQVTRETQEMRMRTVDDVQKRKVYRKKHGLEHKGIGGWTAPSDQADDALAMAGDGEQADEPERRPRRKVKRWFGIWE